MSSLTNPMVRYKARKRSQHKDALENYDVLGYIAAGTYGRVYKARDKATQGLCAIKKFKTDKDGTATYYTGISQSACREMALCRELKHDNVIYLLETILEEKSIYLVFDYAEHDLLQIIHHHCHIDTPPLSKISIKSIMFQLLSGIDYLHRNWVLHRDLKPANIMITAGGVVKIGDLGLARLFNNPLQSLFSGDKVVVTIWYRAPELLLGGRHYTPAIDIWATGCIFSEILALRPIFKGEEAKMDSKKVIPFQKDQMQKVVEVLGTPTPVDWPQIRAYPDYPNLQQMRTYSNHLEQWFRSVGHPIDPSMLSLLKELLCYDPEKRLTAAAALQHPYFTEAPLPQTNAFENVSVKYPPRRITSDTDVKAAHGSKRAHGGSESSRKKVKA